VEENLDPILIQVTVPLPLTSVHAALLDPSRLKGWLCDEATVEPKVGGAYRLRWTGASPFESPGTITQLTPDLDLGFRWFAPQPFVALMNQPEPKTSACRSLPRGSTSPSSRRAGGAGGPGRRPAPGTSTSGRTAWSA
jgi:uncharacterized protein YndB with AHSA1/START domain